VWAFYKFLEYDWLTCPHERPCVEYHEWDIDRWQGSLVLKNPDKKCANFTGRGRHRHCVRKKRIGIVKYKVPRYTFCGGTCVHDADLPVLRLHEEYGQYADVFVAAERRRVPARQLTDHSPVVPNWFPLLLARGRRLRFGEPMGEFQFRKPRRRALRRW
jgi:hypothetical protein